MCLIHFISFENQTKVIIISITVLLCSQSFFSPFPLFQWTFVRVVLNIRSVWFDRSVATSFHVFFPIPSSEAPFLRSEDFLTTRELELSTSQSFNSSWFVVVFATNRHQRLTNIDTNPDVESIFTSNLGHVLVGTNTSSLQSFSGQLLVFIGHKIHTLGKFINSGLLLSKIEDSNLWVWHTTAETRFWIGFVLAVAVTACRTATHFQ